ncbi:MAG TPA: hypothetical protein VMS17_14570 [Gemmataceae bacterium]|nr:hypothetical protein [Gemmataceae bacterium]
MWTPKRIVLLALGFFVFFSGYMLYSSALGGIDGLPPLPHADLPPDHPGVGGPMPPSHGLKLDDKLRQAFGQDCRELNWPLKLELNSKNMVVAAREFHIEESDGRLYLDRVSVALFKEPRDGREVEINTLRAREAYLTFDQKLGRNDKEFGGRRIVAAELIGDPNVPGDGIEIVNNHCTRERNDDLHLNVAKGPLYYDEAKSLIWTDDDVRVEDDQNQPPTVVLGRGMEVHLSAPEVQPPAKPAGRVKPRTGGFSGVDRIVIKSNVDMNLYVAGGFLSNGAEAKPKAAAPPASPTKAHVSIRTDGRFEYEFRKDGDVARFDAPAVGAGPQGGNPFVTVIRHTDPPDPKTAATALDASTTALLGSPSGQGSLLVAPALVGASAAQVQQDTLICRRLELQISRKESAPGGHNDGTDRTMTIDRAHASVQNGADVVVKSDEQKLTASCYDLQYDARSKLTVLKADPNKPDARVDADQDDNIIHAREIQLLEMPPGPDGRPSRQATALGPGQIDLFDKKTKKYPVHAAWQDKLISSKDGGDDLIVLTGAATFIDDEQGQSMKADTLKVWLISAEGGPTAAPARTDAPTTRRPRRLEASGNVSVASSQLNIPAAGFLDVKFTDVPNDALPDAPPPAKPAAFTPAQPAPVAGPAAPEAPKPTGPDAAAATDADLPRPLSLSARSVYAEVLRSDQKSQLKELRADGFVKVHQDPAKGAEHGVDVEGEQLLLTYHPEGNFLSVMSDVGDGDRNRDRDLAKLRMEGMYIIGPEVNIDQASNQVWVTGAGALMMESKSDLQGKPLDKAVPMTIYWKHDMFFNGRIAVFTDSVQAEQDEAHLACQVLQATFDRSISLKEEKGNKNEPQPRIKKLVCDKDVRVDDRTLEGERVVRQQQMIAPLIAMTTIEPDDPTAKPDAPSEGNEINAEGPGVVRLYQQGGQDPLATPPGPSAKTTAAKPAADKPAPAGKSDDQMKITYISYGTEIDHGRMYANTKTNRATFLQNVRVLNMPCSDPNMDIDLDAVLNRMPEGALYLKCDRMDVFDRGDKKKSQQEMYAKGHVRVQSKDFWGYSDTMTYNEAKDQIIFEGGENGLATLYKQKQRGGETQKIEGKTIIYIRSTGMFKIEGGEWISAN